MTHFGEAAIIGSTFFDRATIKRQSFKSGAEVWERVHENIPCALSRAAKTSAPAPTGGSDFLAESAYRLSLFLPPDIVTKLGDVIEVEQGSRIFCGHGSDSVNYVSHSVCVFQVLEVKDRD